LPRFADGYHADYRRNPDGDPEDRQNASHLVPKQRHEGGAKESRVVHNFPPAVTHTGDPLLEDSELAVEETYSRQLRRDL